MISEWMEINMFCNAVQEKKNENVRQEKRRLV